MTVRELAAYLNVDQSTVKRWRQRRKIPAPSLVLENGTRLWSPEQVQEILDKRTGKS